MKLKAESLEEAVQAIKSAFPDAHINEISDTAIEVYVHDEWAEAADVAVISQNRDAAWGYATDWSVRMGFTSVIDSALLMAETAVVCDSLSEATEHAIEELRLEQGGQ